MADVGVARIESLLPENVFRDLLDGGARDAGLDGGDDRLLRVERGLVRLELGVGEAA